MKQNKRKPVIGEKLYLVDTGNRARNGMGTQTYVFVRKVGKKYFRVNKSMDGKEWTDVVFHIASWAQSTDYSCDYLLFESEQEYLDSVEANKIHEHLRKEFSGYGNTTIPLDKLRQIKAILES